MNRRRPAPPPERKPLRARVRSLCWRALKASLPAALTLLAIAAVAAACVFGYRWLTGSERFAVAAIEVRGARALPAAEVERVVAPAFGQNVFRVSLAAIERRLRAEPWIAGASVRRSLPDTLVVEVEERRAAAVAELGGLYLVDERGHAFKRADVGRGEAGGLLVVTGSRARTTSARRPRRPPGSARRSTRRAPTARAAAVPRSARSGTTPCAASRSTRGAR